MHVTRSEHLVLCDQCNSCQLPNNQTVTKPDPVPIFDAGIIIFALKLFTMNEYVITTVVYVTDTNILAHHATFTVSTYDMNY